MHNVDGIVDNYGGQSIYVLIGMYVCMYVCDVDGIVDNYGGQSLCVLIGLYVCMCVTLTVSWTITEVRVYMCL